MSFSRKLRDLIVGKQEHSVPAAPALSLDMRRKFVIQMNDGTYYKRPAAGTCGIQRTKASRDASLFASRREAAKEVGSDPVFSGAMITEHREMPSEL